MATFMKPSDRPAPAADARGFSLVEVLVALFLIGLGVLAAAPMFIYAMQGNATGADFGSVGAIAVERWRAGRFEQLDVDAAPGMMRRGT